MDNKKNESQVNKEMSYSVTQLMEMPEFAKYSKDYMMVLLPKAYYTKTEAKQILQNYFKG